MAGGLGGLLLLLSTCQARHGVARATKPQNPSSIFAHRLVLPRIGNPNPSRHGESSIPVVLAAALHRHLGHSHGLVFLCLPARGI